ncbi:HemK2/MTQ2 family protein methyltransferase [Streptomyces sp. NPDC052396]|uniref:HemK2/MTQ2 family protein methyltransferase n=1 Tax=Streptomyces sp. NPDC052396 TaxID=3365689 RepID=UPI0037D21F6F
MRLLRAPGVYPPQADSFLLRQALGRERLPPGARVLDIGSGTGALAISAARQSAARVVAVDSALGAVLSTRLNALLAGARVTVRHGDLLAPVAGQRFHLVLANPPYVPSTAPRGSRTVDAGYDGRAVLDRLTAQVPDALLPGGVLLLVQSALSGVSETVRALTTGGLKTGITDRRLVPLGPVLRARGDWLRRRGLLDAGQDKEELVVIRAQRPG